MQILVLQSQTAIALHTKVERKVVEGARRGGPGLDGWRSTRSAQTAVATNYQAKPYTVNSHMPTAYCSRPSTHQNAAARAAALDMTKGGKQLHNEVQSHQQRTRNPKKQNHQKQAKA